MAKTTMLEIVQKILSDADGDEVNNVSDTIESTQCAQIVKDEFDIIADEFDLKMGVTLDKLEATTSSTPVVMTRPEGFHSIERIWYDNAASGGDPDYELLTFMEPERFLTKSMALNVSDTNVSSLTLGNSGHTLNFRNDQGPTYWTILEGYDDIVFDAYDSTLETNLQASKSLARGTQRPTLTIANTSVADLPENLMVLLKNRARSMYFDLYKDGATPAVARRERYSEVRAQRKKYITKKLQQERTGPNYGRKR